MKIALITDTHWGVRQDSIPFLFNAKKFLDDVFFPTLEEENIDTIIHLGDLFDRRKYINFLTLQRIRTDFIQKLSGYDFHLLLGNHDIFYRNNLDVVSIYELGLNEDFKIYKNATEVVFDGLKILFVPWVCDENSENTYKLIQETDATIVMGHLELAGFQMYKGLPNHGGVDSKLYQKFDAVYSGHYHHKSSAGNIHYLGAFAEFDWSDYNDPRGFHIFDTDTKEIHFIANPYRMFRKIFYDDVETTLDPLMETIDSSLKNTVVKVIVKNRKNSLWFDCFISRLESMGVLNFQVIEDHYNIEVGAEPLVDGAEDTLTFMKKVIETTKVPEEQKQKLDVFMTSLYHDALKLGVD